MSDFYFKRFYDDVKDPSWPDVTNYSEFCKLPNRIVQECVQNHNLPQRLENLGDSAYWIQQSGLNKVYTNGSLAYLPIPKCASSSYTRFFFEQLGWQSVRLTDLDPVKTKILSFVINPWTRRLKGVVEILCRSYEHNYDKILLAIQDRDFLDFVSRVMIVDNHSTPYSLVFQPWFDQINWIPMDILSTQEIHNAISLCFADTKENIDLTKIPKLNESSAKKKTIYTLIEQKFLSQQLPSEVGLMFAEDVKFYNRLVSKFASM
jgi:hypothetical protein